MDLRQEVRDEARRLGFHAVGFAQTRRHPLAARLREWLDRDYAGGMDWLARRASERSDPTRLIPWARSLVLVALPYSPAPSPAARSLPARLSRYARGRDYHAVMKRRLQRLGACLSTLAPQARWCPVVDTGAILEKPWAATAGLGWQGKHTNLIHPEAGSWFFLGELVTDQVLEPEAPPLADRCGTCTRCLDACPTQAFPEPYVLDASRCVSYLTIEHRGSIPAALRSAMGSWIFGCDVCQEVCPWNQDPAAGDAELGEDAGVEDLAELMELTPEEFRRRFSGTPLRRTGWRRLLRNGAVALGNSRDPRAVEVLRRALRIPDPLIREHVEWALGQLGCAAPGVQEDGAEERR
jgi:epoxyqueuosine reductase